MKACGGVDIWIHNFLTSALAEGELSASGPGRFIPGEIFSSTHRIGGWLEPRAGLDDVGEEKILDPTGTRTLNSRSSSP
jgi:hypothetical protein